MSTSFTLLVLSSGAIRLPGYEPQTFLDGKKIYGALFRARHTTMLAELNCDS